MTIILWDIDGVLNPFMASGLSHKGYFHVSEGWISWDIDLVNHAEWMRELSTKSEMVWCSAWEEESNIISFYFGLDETLDYIPLSQKHMGISGVTWKLDSVKKWLTDRDDLVIWLDDEFEQDAYAWANERGKTKLIACDPAVGFTEEQYEEILVLIS